MTVYVVCQNDFPVAVFDTHAKAMSYMDERPKTDVNGRRIFWCYHPFVLNQLERPT